MIASPRNRLMLWVRRLLVAGGLMVVLACVHAPVLHGAARWLDVGQKPVAVDYVVVLPGELNTRPFVAAALVNAGLARRVIVPEPRTSLDVAEGRVKAHEEVTRMVLESRRCSRSHPGCSRSKQEHF